MSKQNNKSNNKKSLADLAALLPTTPMEEPKVEVPKPQWPQLKDKGWVVLAAVQRHNPDGRVTHTTPSEIVEGVYLDLFCFGDFKKCWCDLKRHQPLNLLRPITGVYPTLEEAQNALGELQPIRRVNEDDGQDNTGPGWHRSGADWGRWGR